MRPRHGRYAGVAIALISLLYVSNAKLETSNADAALAALLAAARNHNTALGISGALIFTGASFAQILEGEAAPVRQLLAKILVDPRHSDIVVLKEWPIDERLFQDWALAYAGPSAYVGRIMAKPLDQALRGADPDIGQLVRLLVQFATSGGTTRLAG